MENNQIQQLTMQLPLLGHVTAVDPAKRSITIKTRSGTSFVAQIRPTAWCDTVTNLDRMGRLRLPVDRQGAVRAADSPDWLRENVQVDHLLALEGVCHIDGSERRYDAVAVHVLHGHAGYYLFEHTAWWKVQIEVMGNKWLDVLFGDKRTYELDDFSALYRTTLGIEGDRTPDDTQEMATLSRLIYGLASAYLLCGDERFFLAARAGVRYQREAFRSLSADGRFCFWLHARKRDRHGRYDVMASQNDEDRDTIPLYEQIYALAGLAQYYRITNDLETLDDIRRTLATFESFFADRRDGKHDGFFSHIDPVTFRWNSESLGGRGDRDLRAMKNWNSVGDHLPAYLINLVLALDPLPQIAPGPSAQSHQAYLRGIHKRAIEILEVTAGLIHDKFPQPDSPFVCERFSRDWIPKYDWGWQKDRAVVGHNLKIAWNLTRVANYYRARGQDEQAARLFELARKLGANIAAVGLDRVRGGVYDTVERHPEGTTRTPQFGWWSTRDFWQQEQGILAYLILFGFIGKPDDPAAVEFREHAREISAVWNLYFLDRDRNGIFFRVGDNGYPVIQSTYGDKGGHSISGYHAFELDYLAHIYQLAYLPREQRQHTTFCLHFRPSADNLQRSINVLPDLLGPDAVEVKAVEVDGVPRAVHDPKNFQIQLEPEDLGRRLAVYLWQSESVHARLKGAAVPDGWLP